jgi:hypothetical protein
MKGKHRWIGNTCIKCGLIRKRKGVNILMAIVNHPPWEAYRREMYWEYFDGIVYMKKRPDCKTII